jgi:hypothetical protein
MFSQACNTGSLLRSSYRSAHPLRRCYNTGHFSRVAAPSRPCTLIRVATEESTGQQDDYYTLLGVHPTADVTQIKRAYRALMREYHPDMSQDEDSTEVSYAKVLLQAAVFG